MIGNRDCAGWLRLTKLSDDDANNAEQGTKGRRVSGNTGTTYDIIYHTKESQPYVVLYLQSFCSIATFSCSQHLPNRAVSFFDCYGCCVPSSVLLLLAILLSLCRYYIYDFIQGNNNCKKNEEICIRIYTQAWAVCVTHAQNKINNICVSLETNGKSMLCVI